MSDIEVYEPTQSDVDRMISGLNNADLTVYSSFKDADFSTRLRVASALTDSEPISDHLGKVINLANVVIHPVELPDEATGEISALARTILIDDEGNAYHAISSVITKRLYDLIGVLGEPHTWPEPVKIRVERVKGSGANFFYDLRVA